MPLPPTPRREWRPIVERFLAAFNGLVLAAYGFYGAPFLAGPCPGAIIRTRVVLAWFPLLALIGFLRRRPWWLRLSLTLPSGVLWLFVGPILTFVGVTSFISLYRPGCSLPWNAPLAIGLLFLVAGVLKGAGSPRRPKSFTAEDEHVRSKAAISIVPLMGHTVLRARTYPRNIRSSMTAGEGRRNLDGVIARVRAFAGTRRFGSELFQARAMMSTNGVSRHATTTAPSSKGMAS